MMQRAGDGSIGRINLSVIIPTRNRPALVRRAMSSVAGQGRDDIEVVVVDDGSTASYDLLGIIPRERLKAVTNTRPMGAACARNAGIEAARGHWIAFLDDDDEWEPHFAERTLQVLEGARDDLRFSWCSIKNIDYGSDGSPTSERLRHFKANGSCGKDLFAEALSIGTSWGLTINRACFERAGVFDGSYGFVEDTELILRLLDAGCAPTIVEDVLVRIHHRVDPARLSCAANDAMRIRECRRLLNHYRAFLDRHPAAAAGLRAHVACLESGLPIGAER